MCPWQEEDDEFTDEDDIPLEEEEKDHHDPMLNQTSGLAAVVFTGLIALFLLWLVLRAIEALSP